MPKMKNALTLYHVSAVSETPEWLQLGPHIRNVNDGTADVTADDAFYDGDGSVQTDVTGTTEEYTFEGDYVSEDPAQALLVALRVGRKVGSERNIMFKVTDPDETTHTGLATAYNIAYRGGLASDVQPFSATIRFAETPEVAPGA